MKKLKDVVILFSITILFLTLTGCNIYIFNDAKNDAFSYITKEIDFENISQNITIPNEYKGVKIEFNSSNQNIITNDGVITYVGDEVQVLCTITLTYDDVVETHAIVAKVKGRKLSEKEQIELVIKEINIPSEVSNDFELPTKYNDVKIVWTSDKENISSDGKLIREEENVSVLLKACFSLNGVEIEKDYLVTVLKDKDLLTINEYEQWLKNVLPNEAFQNVNLPQKHNEFIGSITYESSNPNIFSDEGIIYPSKNDEKITLKYTINYNGSIKEGYVEIVVKGFDKEKRLEEVIDSLSKILNLDGTRVNSNIDLIKTSKYNSIITWSSSNENIVSTSGVVTQTDKDEEVTLNFIINLDGDVYDNNQAISIIVPKKVISTLEPYYRAAQGLTGISLKNKLHDIIKSHNKLSYSELWTAIPKTDKDPNNSKNVILLYTGYSLTATKHGGNQGEWNREHVWAQSRGGFNTSAGPGTDLHHMRPTWTGTNSTRGNLDFDEGGKKVEAQYGAGSSYSYVNSGVSFEPRDEVKGDIARMLFYMATRYDGGGEVDLELFDKVGSNNSSHIGKLSTLLKWHIEDPVDSFEKNRNEQTYLIQGNRNPFIDHPEFVQEIWGTSSKPIIIKNDIDLALERRFLDYNCILNEIKEKYC